MKKIGIIWKWYCYAASGVITGIAFSSVFYGGEFKLRLGSGDVTIHGVKYYSPISVDKYGDSAVVISRKGCGGSIEHGYTSEGGPMLDWKGKYYGYSVYKIYKSRIEPVGGEHADPASDAIFLTPTNK